jgi:membrane protease YdiL (CAAX protease family)
MLASHFSSVPYMTVAMISAPIMSLMIADIFVAMRSKFFPRFKISRETIVYILAGILMAWIVCFLQILFEGKGIPFAHKILETPFPYFYINVVFLIFLGPFLEELLYRGYFFELLRQNSTNARALLVSTFLFIIPHGIWGGFDSGLIFIFLLSVINTLMYIRGGLIPSITVHAFANFYLLWLNMG